MQKDPEDLKYQSSQYTAKILDLRDGIHDGQLEPATGASSLAMADYNTWRANGS